MLTVSSYVIALYVKPLDYSPENSNVKFCIWVSRIGGCTVELVNSLFVFSVNITHCFVLLYA